MRNAEPIWAGVIVTSVVVQFVATDGAPTLVQAPAGTALILGAGFSLSRVIFGSHRMRWMERFVSTLALAVSVVIVASLAIHLSPWTMNRRTWSVALGGVGLCGMAPALWSQRRRGTAVRETEVRPARRRWRVLDVVACAGVVVILAVVVAVARQPMASPEGVSGYTQLWLIPNANGAELGLASFEFSSTNYRVELLSGDSLVQEWRIEVAPNGRWAVEIALLEGDLQARLYRDGEPAAYRRVGPVTPGASSP